MQRKKGILKGIWPISEKIPTLELQPGASTVSFVPGKTAISSTQNLKNDSSSGMRGNGILSGNSKFQYSVYTNPMLAGEAYTGSNDDDKCGNF